LGRNVQIISIRKLGNSTPQTSCVSKVTVNTTEEIPRIPSDSSSDKVTLTQPDSRLQCWPPSSSILPLSHFPTNSLLNNSLKRTQSALVTKHVQVSQLKEHCRSLEGELDGVKSEIVRIIQEKQGCLEENCVLQQYKKVCKELEKEREIWKAENEDLRKENWRLMTEITVLRTEKEHEGNDEKDVTDDEDEDEEEEEVISEEVLQKEEDNEEHTNKNIQVRCSPDGQEGQKKKEEEEYLKDHVRTLEDSLYLLRAEFDSLESYWTSKLAEERKNWSELLGKFEEKMKSSRGEQENKNVKVENNAEEEKEEEFLRICLRECGDLTEECGDLLRRIVREIIRLQNLRCQLQEECDIIFLEKQRLIYEKELLKKDLIP